MVVNTPEIWNGIEESTETRRMSTSNNQPDREERRPISSQQDKEEERFYSARSLGVGKHVLSVKDVLMAHPAEDPSETKLLCSLEEGSNGSSQRIVIQKQPSQGRPSLRRRLTAPKSSKRKVRRDVEDELAALTQETTATHKRLSICASLVSLYRIETF